MNKIKDGAINIILDCSNPKNSVFVEIENDKFESINIGERTDRIDGLTEIRITVKDIINQKVAANE